VASVYIICATDAGTIARIRAILSEPCHMTVAVTVAVATDGRVMYCGKLM